MLQASMVGHKYGVLRWSKTGSKSSNPPPFIFFYIYLFCIIVLIC